MFSEFISPELKQSCKRLSHSIFHLDGVGELAHLDNLLAINELDAIQWVPGEGKAPCDEWPWVYQKIKGSGKLMQVVSYDFNRLNKIIHFLDGPEGIHHPTIYIPIEKAEYALDWLDKLGVER